jgi:Flp pilus assembly protein TadD
MVKPDVRWIVILLVAAAVYLNTFGNGFVYDDFPIIRDNEDIRTLGGMPRAFVTPYWGKEDQQNRLYRPLVISSYAVDYYLFGDQPSGYHLWNVLLHALNSLLVYLLCLFLWRGDRDVPAPEGAGQAAPWWAFAAALLFAVHPVHTDAVTALVGRAELMAAFFVFIAFISYLHYRGSGRSRFYALSLAAFFLALLSKENAIVLPVLIVVHDVLSHVFIKKDRPVRVVKACLGLFCVAALYLAVRYQVIGGIGPASDAVVLAGVPAVTRLATMVTVFGTYLKLLVFPLGLQAYYDDCFPMAGSLLAPIVILSGLALIAAAAIAVYLYRKKSMALFPLLWIFIGLLPVSQIIPIGALMAERFLYLPSAGFSILAAAGLHALWRRGSRRFTVMIGFVVFLVALLMVWSVWTIRRNRVWKDPARFWSTLARDAPQSGMALYNMGVVRMMAGEKDEAIRYFERAVNADPDRFEPHLNLGILYEERGEWTDALRAFERAREVAPEQIRADYRLGRLHLKTRNFAGAEAAFRSFISRRDGHAPAWFYLGESLAGAGKFSEAGEAYSRAAALNPQDCRFYLSWGKALEAADLLDEALRRYRDAWACGREEKAVPAIGRMLFRLGRRGEAETFLTGALEDPGISKETREAVERLRRYFKTAG